MKKPFATRTLVGALTIFLCAGGLYSSRAFGKQAATTRAQGKPAAASVLVADNGKFRILVEGQQVGSEDFQIGPGGAGAGTWMAQGKTETNVAGAAPRQYTARLELAPDGSPLRYEWTGLGQKKRSIIVDFESGTAKMALQLAGVQPFLQEFSFPSGHVVILDNNVYHHFAILARLYDWNAKGRQTFPVLIPQDQFPGSITAEAFGAQVIDGATLELLRVRSTDLEINLYLDSSHRLMRLTVPSTKALVLRE